VSKIENFRVPFIGWNMSLNRYVKLRRGNRASVVQMMKECRETLAAGNSIMMFPEGTRSPDGRMRAFKTGAFELALECGRPILPIVIQGTSDALPKHGFVLRGRHPITVTILEELPVERFRGDTVEALTNRVRSIIAERVGEKAEPPPAR
jgi:1-acyl-sn-glycerol-3-phosphate acyltransferase